MQYIKRGQISVEYLIMVGFVIFLVMGILAAGLISTSQLKNRIIINQVNNAMNKIIQSAESVFYAGEPSRVKISIYLPSGVKSLSIQNKTIIVQIQTDSGVNIVSYSSAVTLEGSIPVSEGIKKIKLQATPTKVLITS